MDNLSMKKHFLDVFLKEWEQRSDSVATTLRDKHKQGVENFDTTLKPGELRLFDVGDSGLVGLLYKQLDAGWVVVPTSEFTVPATEQEILIGKRVYQLWNTCTMPEEFVGRSWLVDTIGTTDMKDLCEALLHVLVGDSLRADLHHCMGLPITSIEDPRLDYERTFATARLFSGEEAIQEGSNALRRKSFLDLPVEFWRKTIDEEIPFRLAAATNAETSFMLLLREEPDDEIIRKSYVECELMNDFRSINPGDDPYKLVFRPKGMPDGWTVKGRIEVQMRNRQTLEVIGTGYYNAETGEIVVSIKSDVKSSVDTPEQLVLAMVLNEG